MTLLRRTCLLLACTGLGMLVAGLALRTDFIWKPGALILCAGLAIGIASINTLRGYQFTLWIITAVVAGMIYPKGFQQWGGVNLRDPWLMLLIVQTVMFGMGLQMSLKDLAGVAQNPLGVLVGIICHFTVMPLVGLGLTKLFSFPPQIAAGIILIGSCSSGLASNVMSYIARANLALAVTVTAVTTLLAPLLTPLWMKALAGDKVPVDYLKMMMEIVTMVLVPIGAALLYDHLNSASSSGRRRVLVLAAVGAAWLVFLAGAGWKTITTHLPSSVHSVVSAMGFLLAAVVFGVFYYGLTRLVPRLNRAMPMVSMAGIVYFTTVTTAAGRDNLLKVGGLLFLAAAMHNTAGYFFGYWLSRAFRLDKNSARSIAFEVGLQNGAMATGIASSMNMLDTMGLPAAIFSPWMNISGSMLANYWRKHATTEVNYELLQPDVSRSENEKVTQRRLTRIALNSVAGASSMATLVFVFLWIVSLWRVDGFSYKYMSDSDVVPSVTALFTAESGGGGILLIRNGFKEADSAEARRLFSLNENSPSLEWHAAKSSEFVWSDVFPKWDWLYRPEESMKGRLSSTRTYCHAFIPYWLLFLASAVLPSLWIKRRLAQRRIIRLIADRRCIVCGYDLRATPDRCPECGTMTSRAIKTPAGLG